VTEIVTLLLEAKDEKQLLRIRQQFSKLYLLSPSAVNSHPIADGDTPEPEACDGIIAAIGRILAAVRKVNSDCWGGRAHGDSGGHLARVAGTDGRRDLGVDRSLTPGHVERVSAVARDRLSGRRGRIDAAATSLTRRCPGEKTMRPFRAGRLAAEHAFYCHRVASRHIKPRRHDSTYSRMRYTIS
jgi:hypothetical protein